MRNFQFWLFVGIKYRKYFPYKPFSQHSWRINCPFRHNRLLNVVGMRIWSRLVAKSGWAEILELLYWTGIFDILAKTLDPKGPLTIHAWKSRQRVVWTCHTFENNFEIKRKYTNYLKETCGLDFVQHSSFKSFLKIPFGRKISQK